MLVIVIFAVVSTIFMNSVDAKIFAEKDKVPVTKALELKIFSMSEQEEVPVIIMLKDYVKENSKKIIKQKIAVEHDYETMNGFSGKITKQALDVLREDKNVLSITMDGPVYATMTESLPLINATVAHEVFYNDLNLTGNGQTVCVIDSGIDYGHFNLGNCTTESFLAGTCQKVVAGFSWCNNTDCTQESDDAMDDAGHGTHVAGIIASNDTTYTGVAPDSQLVAMKILNSQGSNPEGWGDVIDAIDWCVNNATKYNISVISMSIGSNSLFNDIDSCTLSGLDAVHLAIKNAVENGIFVSVSSGNNANPIHIAYPSCSPNATSVGAVYDSNYGSLGFSVCTDSTTSADKVSCFSNGGVLLDILAPGSRIISSSLSGGLTTKDGTSMACPMVSGAITLLNEYKKWENGQNLDVMTMKTALTSSGTNITDTRIGGSIYPRLDIYGALLTIDKKSPIVNVTGPLSITYNFTENIMINYTAQDILGVSSCKYSIDNDSNITLTSCLNASFNTTVGSHIFTLYVTDISGNTNTTVISFAIDSSEPIITLISPDNSSSISSGILINLSVSDSDSQIDTVWWHNNTNERNNISKEGNSYYINTTNWISQIWQNITIYANDTFNNTVSSFYRFVNNSVPFHVKNISQQNWSQDSSFILNLSNFFNDIDSDLTYSATLPNNITVQINQSLATLTPDNGFFGARNIFFYANDSFSVNVSDNATLNVLFVNNAPVFMALENRTITKGYSFIYDINATDVDNDQLNYTVINITTNSDFINFTINQITGVLTNSTPIDSTGLYIIYLNVTDDKSWTEDYLVLTVNLLPIFDTFVNALTTNFTLYNDTSIQDIANFTIGIPWLGLINFTNQNVNLSSVDLDSYVTIAYNLISVDSVNLPQLNIPARLTIYNLSFSTTPVVFKDGLECTTCDVVDYTGGNFTFDVTGFSNYSAATTSVVTTSVATTTTTVSSGGGGSPSSGGVTTTSTEPTLVTTSILEETTTIETTVIDVTGMLINVEQEKTMGYLIILLILGLVVVGGYLYFKG